MGRGAGGCSGTAAVSSKASGASSAFGAPDFDSFDSAVPVGESFGAPASVAAVSSKSACWDMLLL